MCERNRVIQLLLQNDIIPADTVRFLQTRGMLPREMELPSGSAPPIDLEDLARDIDDALPNPARLDTEVLLDMPDVSGHVVMGGLEVKCFVDRAGAVYLQCSLDWLREHAVELDAGVRLKLVSATPVLLSGKHWQRVELEVT
jgi:hypothetical protein